MPPGWVMVQLPVKAGQVYRNFQSRSEAEVGSCWKLDVATRLSLEGSTEALDNKKNARGTPKGMHGGRVMRVNGRMPKNFDGAYLIFSWSPDNDASVPRIFRCATGSPVDRQYRMFPFLAKRTLAGSTFRSSMSVELFIALTASSRVR